MRDLKQLETSLGLAFRNPSLLEQALVHRSYLNENPAFPLPSNERLEFLGDAVLGFIVAERLYQLFPNLPEGKLTAYRANLVCQENLYRVASSLYLGEYLFLGRGETDGGGRSRPSNLARALEAVVGAVMIDHGMKVARRLVLRLLAADLATLKAGQEPLEYKSHLQEILQAQGKPSPTYHTMLVEGEEHQRRFTVEVRDGDTVLGVGSGRSKRSAEREAARATLEKLKTLKNEV